MIFRVQSGRNGRGRKMCMPIFFTSSLRLIESNIEHISLQDRPVENAPVDVTELFRGPRWLHGLNWCRKCVAAVGGHMC